MQRTTGEMNMKDLKKYARPRYLEVQKALGAADKEGE
jgi:hypothetical protein